jgi:Domain of unknown function (DUF4373)
MPKDTFYFSHDYNSRNDEKIKKLIRKHGMQGYGIFWAIVEELYNNANALHLDYDGIAFDLRTESEIIKSVLHDFDLFVFNGDNFGSLSVQNRINNRQDKSQKARDSAYSRWNKNKIDANAVQTQSDTNAIKERKGKEIKGKESKESKPSIDEFLSFCKDDMIKNGMNFSLYEYSLKSKFSSWVENNWKDGNNKPIKSWKSKIRNTIPFLKPISLTTSNSYQDKVNQAVKAFKPIQQYDNDL